VGPGRGSPLSGRCDDLGVAERTQLCGRPVPKGAGGNPSLRETRAYGADASLARVQDWLLQNSPPRTQPSTRNTSALLSAIVAA
jgi:hypothetical protein